MVASIDRLHDSGTTISFGQKMTRSPRFAALFAEGMDLVEEAATYLDGPGRDDARALRSSLAGAYSTESMRLTTRLMQIASWLLIRRAIIDGETPSTTEGPTRFKANAQGIVSPAAVFVQLPGALQSLATRSMRLQTRILHLDEMVNDNRAEPETTLIANGPSVQWALLSAVFGRAS
jgi:regulator of CtrA degradation